MPSCKRSVTLATNNGEGDGDSLCYDNNNIVVVITQTALLQALLALALTIFAGKGEEGWRETVCIVMTTT